MKKKLLLSLLGLGALVGGIAATGPFTGPATGAVQEVATVYDLVGVNPFQIAKAYLVKGYTNSGDGYGGIFIWDGASTNATNATRVFASQIAASGRFLKIGSNLTLDGVSVTAPTNTITGNLTSGTIPQGSASTNLVDSPLSVSGGTNVLATGRILANGITITNNVLIGGATVGTSGARVIAISGSTAPTTSPADTVQLWEADRGGTAGKAGLHIRTEDGTSHVFGDLVGIGTTAPKTTLSLSIAGPHNSVGESTGALSFMTDDGSYTGTITNGVTGKIDSISESSTGSTYGLGFFTGTVGSAGFGERVRIDHDGNVGIGTTVFGTSAANVLALGQSTDPTSRPADIVQVDASDVVAGDTAFKIFPEATASRYAFGQRARFQGDLIFTNVANGLPYGGIGGGGLSATQTISGSSTPTLVNIAGLAVGLTNEISSGTNYLSPTWPGVYRVEWSMSVDGTTGHDIQGGIMVDGVAITTRGTASIQAIGSAHQSMSSSANVSCPATTNQVSLFLNNRTAAANVNIYDLSVTMTMVGGQ